MIPELQRTERCPSSARVVIVGAGPHALTVAAHMLEIDPRGLEGELVVVDPSGRWLGKWRRRMAALEIPHLRSPVVHHPAPPPYELQDFARKAERSTELHGRYQLPGVELFDDFCDSVIDR
jgi:cation diffusion facilitator CzcD-associated flavoprotein CzcO